MRVTTIMMRMRKRVCVCVCLLLLSWSTIVCGSSNISQLTKMPTHTVASEVTRICCVKEEGGIKEPVSNFEIGVIASVHVSSGAGGPKRYPDNVEK